MSRTAVVLALLLIGANCAFWADELPYCRDPFSFPVTMQTSPSTVDISRYMGVWFEIARMRFTQQEDCVCSQATYRLNQEGGYVDVNNACINRDGSSGTAVAKAYSRNDQNTKLQVYFTFNPTVGGNYWILDIDAEYQWVIVGEPCKRSAWILSRTKTITPVSLNLRLDTLRKAGYEVGNLLYRDPKC